MASKKVNEVADGLEAGPGDSIGDRGPEGPAGAAETRDPMEELVTIRLFRDNDKYKDDVFVAVNGESVQIRRGETVQIKRKFAQVLEESMSQDMATAKLIDSESRSYEQEAKRRGL